MSASKDDLLPAARFTLASPGDGAYKVRLYNSHGLSLADFVMTGPDALESLDVPPGNYHAQIFDFGRKRSAELVLALDSASGATSAVSLSPQEWMDDSEEAATPLAMQVVEEDLRRKLAGAYRKSQTLKTGLGAAVASVGSLASDGLARSLGADSMIGIGSSSEAIKIHRQLLGDLANSDGGELSFTHPLDKVKELGDVSKSDLVREARYVSTKKDGGERLNFTAFYEALLESKGVSLGQSSPDNPVFEIGLSESMPEDGQTGWLPPSDLAFDYAERAAPGVVSITIRERRPKPRKTRLRLNVSVAGLPTMRAPVPLYSGGVTLRIAPLMRETGADFLIDIIAVEERVEALVVALKRMADADALATLEWASGAMRDDAISILAKKQNDLWAASVAALILARSGEIGTRLHWFENLANWAPHIADTPIALAGALAVAGDGETAALERKLLEQLKRSDAIGSPNFVAAHQLSLDLLDGLRTAATDRDVRRAARDLYSRGTSRSRKRTFESAYVIWEHLHKGQLRKGQLPAERYLRVATGRLGPTGFGVEHWVYE